jgi:hypothetical protein
MLISPIPFKLIHQPPLVLAFSSLFITNNKSIYLGLHWKSWPIHIGPNLMSQVYVYTCYNINLLFVVNLLGDNYKAINFNFVSCLSLDGDKHANKVVAWHCWFLTLLFCEDVMKYLPLSICVKGSRCEGVWSSSCPFQGGMVMFFWSIQSRINKHSCKQVVRFFNWWCV